MVQIRQLAQEGEDLIAVAPAESGLFQLVGQALGMFPVLGDGGFLTEVFLHWTQRPFRMPVKQHVQCGLRSSL